MKATDEKEINLTPRHGGRSCGVHIKVWVTPEEKAAIGEAASHSGMKASAAESYSIQTSGSDQQDTS